MVKISQKYINFVLILALGIIGVILTFLLQYKLIDPSFSALFVFIGAGVTAVFNHYLQSKAEERSSLKEALKEKSKSEKISIVIGNILLLNTGVSKANIKILESRKFDQHLHELKTGFLEMAINNISLDETVGDHDIIQIMNISITTETINSNIKRREELTKKFHEIDDVVTKSGIEENIISLNKRLEKNSKKLIDQIKEYATAK